MDITFKTKGKKIRLEDLDAGELFIFDRTIALKSEYRTDTGEIEAYIIGSGEMFWGGAKGAEEQQELLVTRLKLINKHKL